MRVFTERLCCIVRARGMDSLDCPRNFGLLVCPRCFAQFAAELVVRRHLSCTCELCRLCADGERERERGPDRPIVTVQTSYSLCSSSLRYGVIRTNAIRSPLLFLQTGEHLGPEARRPLRRGPCRSQPLGRLSGPVYARLCQRKSPDKTRLE